MSKKIAGITGIRGQDGSYLARYLLELGYEVIGLDRRSGNGEKYNWRHRELGIENKFKIDYCEITEYESVRKVIEKYQFDEIYNLAAESFVQTSFDHPFHTMDVNTQGHLNILEAVRHYNPHTKLYFAGSSEMFGRVQAIPQDELTPFYPRSPYGVSKLSSYWLTKNYRESYNLKCCTGILYNHESPLRGEEFVTRKITKNIAYWFYKNKNHTFELGNIDAKRDWGHAKDYVVAQHLMLQQEKDVFEDYVVATNETHSIRDFIKVCCDHLGFECEFKGKNLEEEVYLEGYKVITINKDFYRPCEVDLLIGNSDKVRKELNWIPEYSFIDLVNEMLDADIERLC